MPMYKYKLKEIEVGDTEIRGGVKSTVTDINPVTGAISWDIVDTADFSSVYKALEKAKRFLDDLDNKSEQTKSDPIIDKLAADIADLFNEFRTHIRKKYPEDYERVKRLKESVNEQSEQWTQGDVISVDKSLRLALKTFNNLVKNLERLDEELSKHNSKPQGDLLQKMVPNSFDYQGTQKKLLKLYNAFNNVFGNALSEALSIAGKKVKKIHKNNSDNPEDFTIEYEDGSIEPYLDHLKEISTTGGGAGAASFTPGTGMQYATPYAFRLKGKKPNIKAYKELGYKEVKENIGATLGPGPKAGSDGVKDSAYVKQFKYKLVPKKIKGSGLEVKQLFEDDTPQAKFQKERVDAFKVIEKELNDIYKMISNAKDETLDYYKDNPSSYAIVKSTDLIIDYLRDIKSLLKIQ